MAVAAVVVVLGVSAYRWMVLEKAYSMASDSYRVLSQSAFTWAGDHDGKLPSPKYPGDYRGDEYPVAGVNPAESKPAYWNLTDSGLWLDGVVYALIYIEDEDPSVEVSNLADLAPSAVDSDRASDGAHLVGTVFESWGSVRRFASETNWYRHSYAMNANLQFDDVPDDADRAEEPWLTEKYLANIAHQAQAMLFIDCIEKNVVMADDVALIRKAAKRYDGKTLVVCRANGGAFVVKSDDIPDGDPFTDPEASKFWRGVEPRSEQ